MVATLPASDLKLFQPIKVGDIELKHRVALAPLTRLRNTADFVPSPPTLLEYYTQRASVAGTLLISEGMAIAGKAGGYPNVPGIWNDDQISAWKKITDAVHARKSYIYAQLWASGRVASLQVIQSSDPSNVVVGPSDIAATGFESSVHPLTKEEIKEYVQLFTTAASNAVDKAGFDGVELHFANGYLVDQFLQDMSNKRTDEYGGSIENRVRFPLELVESVVKAIGEKKTAVRLSPWSTFQDMRMTDPKPTFTYIVAKFKELYTDLAFIHIIEPRVNGDNDGSARSADGDSNDFIREIWSPRPIVSAGGYNLQSAIKAAEKGDIIAFGRYFISNPDLPYRLYHKLALNAYDRPTFYMPGDHTGKGYTDYPFSKEFLEAEAALRN